jgi:hypothetical protein
MTCESSIITTILPPPAVWAEESTEAVNSSSFLASPSVSYLGREYEIEVPFFIG